jgi:hypothetical protein
MKAVEWIITFIVFLALAFLAYAIVQITWILISPYLALMR